MLEERDRETTGYEPLENGGCPSQVTPAPRVGMRSSVMRAFRCVPTRRARNLLSPSRLSRSPLCLSLSFSLALSHPTPCTVSHCAICSTKRADGTGHEPLERWLSVQVTSPGLSQVTPASHESVSWSRWCKASLPRIQSSSFLPLEPFSPEAGPSRTRSSHLSVRTLASWGPTRK